MKSYLFYAGQLVETFNSPYPVMGQYLLSNWGLEIYNGGYIYASKDMKNHEWFRADGTPVLKQDVPKKLLMLLLLLS